MDHQMLEATAVAMQSKSVANSALINLRGDSSKLREVNARIREIDSQLREDMTMATAKSPTCLDELCGAVDDLDAITRDMHLELRQHRTAVADINQAATNTMGTLLTAKQRMLRKVETVQARSSGM